MERKIKLTINDYKTNVWVDWCPGCGNYGILSAMYQAFATYSLSLRRPWLSPGLAVQARRRTS